MFGYIIFINLSAMALENAFVFSALLTLIVAVLVSQAVMILWIFAQERALGGPIQECLKGMTHNYE